jgi:uncharacterized membrane protein
MVSATQDTDRSLFVLSPNPPPPWREIKVFFGAIALTSLAVSTAFAMMGFWPVLPSAGLDLAGLGVALYVTAKRGEVREVVKVSNETVEVERGRYRAEQRWKTHRTWAQVWLLKPRSPLRPSRLVIRSHGQELELGPFLAEKERQQLAGKLRAAIA